MNLTFMCNYCGHVFKTYVWDNNLDTVRCPICNDKSLKMIDGGSGKNNDPFGYLWKPKEKPKS